jgi:isoquinoline 1-oxidoreductase beta subunit
VKVEWDETNAFVLGSDAIFAQYKALAQKPGLEAKKVGDVAGAFASAARHIDAAYEFPFLSHASMEPLNCVAQVSDGGCEIWNGEQLHTPDQGAVAKYLALKPEQIKINMLFAGGSFGRRGNPHSDYVLDTVAIAQAGGKGKPVKLVWSREDDMRGGFYRPAYYHSMKAGLDKAGKITSWQQRIVGQSIMAGTILDNGAPIDSSSVEGASTLPYGIPNLQVELHTTKIGVPIQWWRSVGSTHTAYAVECFIDDIARATKQDPVALRRELLASQPRHLAVLNAAAEKSGWGSPSPAGTARGIALHESFGTVVAEVVEVSKRDANFKVDRVTCVVDCGIAVNPNIIAMQMESAIAYGLSAATTGAITLKDGVVQQSNFHQYTVLRMNQMPKVDVHIMPSTNNPSGVGEPGTPPIGPALANALSVLTGKSYHTLPLSGAGVTIV